MDVSHASLYFPIMPYFSGIEWLHAGHLPQCTTWVDKRFDGYCCLNFARSGSVKWRTGRRRFLALHAPVAWWTFPGPRFQYGYNGSEPWDHYFLCFRGPRVAAFARHGLLPLDANRAWAQVSDAVG